ncbi:MAG: envelope stress response membrane protein PspC [Burkholderiales bacterium]
MRDDNWRAQRFYRDPRGGKLMGVCAGVADYFGWNITLVRVLAVIALLWFNLLTLAVYLTLGFMLPTKPDVLYDWDADEAYWRSVRRSAGDTFRDVRHRFRQLDTKLQRMEGYVTSSRYDLDRQFRDLEH